MYQNISHQIIPHLKSLTWYFDSSGSLIIPARWINTHVVILVCHLEHTTHDELTIFCCNFILKWWQQTRNRLFPDSKPSTIMSAMASQIPTLTIVYSTLYSGADQSSASVAFMRGIHRWPVNSPHNMFPFDDVIMPNHFTPSAIVALYTVSHCIRPVRILFF